MSLRLTSFLLVAICLSTLPAAASCFSIFENGTRAAGMAGAFTALANDGSAIFYNPAGIAFQKGTRMEMDGIVVVGLFRFEPESTPPGQYVPEKGFNLNVSPHFIPVASMYLTKDISPRWTLGFGAFAPFGLAANATGFKDSDAPETKFVGRFAGTRGKLESFWFQPTLAYRLTRNSALAVGAAWVHTHLLIEQSIINPNDDGIVFGEKLASKIFPSGNSTLAGKVIARMLPEGRSRLAGTSDEPGFNAGYLYRNDKSGLSFGLSYRSAVVHHIDGKASFAFTTGYALEPFIGKDTIPNLFPTQPVKSGFVTPATYSVGVATTRFFHTTLAADLQMQDYQRFKDVKINFSQTTDTATPPELVLPFSFRNSYLARVGAERALNRSTDLRLGYFFDYSPVEDVSVGPLFPDSSRHNLTIGFSKRMAGNQEFSFFYQAMWMPTRTTSVPENNDVWTNGEYRNFVHIFGFGLRFRLGAGGIDATANN
jgi:long-chain fatty acid transport protein